MVGHPTRTKPPSLGLGPHYPRGPNTGLPDRDRKTEAPVFRLFRGTSGVCDPEGRREKRVLESATPKREKRARHLEPETTQGGERRHEGSPRGCSVTSALVSPQEKGGPWCRLRLETRGLGGLGGP